MQYEHAASREFAVSVLQKLQGAGFRALFAGGCVRDLLLGRTPDDFDVATDATPDEVRKLFGMRRTLAVGAAFGVIVVRGEKPANDVEVATFRTEGPYLDGRRPERVAFCSPEEDAARRDFTINGMFFDPLLERVFDFVGGQRDLADKVVRAIGDPCERFREDKLRMLRAVRFSANLGFELEVSTASAIATMAADILVVSQERIAQELKKMLLNANRVRAVELARECQLLPVILPELASLLRPERHADWQALLETIAHVRSPSFELALATLLNGMARNESTLCGEPARSLSPKKPHPVTETCRRLKLSNEETDHITALVLERHELRDAPAVPAARLKRFFAKHFPRGVDFIELNRAESLTRNADLAAVQFCEQFLANPPVDELNPPPLLTGDDLIREGLRPSPLFKQLLEALRDEQLNGSITTRAAALDWVRARLCESV